MDEKAVNVLKNLTIDMIQNSGNGHPGIAMSSAPILYTLFTYHLRVNPAILDWVNRDRFVLSASHASELLYATMFLSGYPITIEDLKQYRKFNSKTPANPEIKTPGIDFSTGLCGEGLASAVGMALAEKIYEKKFNYQSKGILDKIRLNKIIDYYTYVLVSDGDLMEGVSYEAASFAASYNLNKLIILYDSNKMTGDGPTSRSFNENVLGRFASMGFNTIYVKNGSSVSEINKAIARAKMSTKPTIIEFNTVLGSGLKDQGKFTMHSKPLTKEVLDDFKVRTNAGSIPFTILKEPASHMRDSVVNRGIKLYDSWKKTLEEYNNVMTQDQIMDFNNILTNFVSFDLTKVNIDIDLEKKESLRDSNHKVMNVIGNSISNFIGGSAELSVSTRSYLDNQKNLHEDLLGKNIAFGVREHAMGSILNGLAISGFRPYGATYMAYSDYLAPSMKMASLMNLPVTYVLTHDSINVGSEGPTYQPIHNIAALRAMPNLYVFRPADIKEIIGTWNIIINNRIPAVISLSKNEIKAENGTNINNVSKGAYIVGKEQALVQAVIIATGSEVQVAKSVQVKLLSDGIDVRVISMPCMELYNRQSDSYKRELFPQGVPVFVIEYSSSFGWEKFVSSSDYLFTVDNFSISASKDDVLKYARVDIDYIIEKIKALL